MYHLSDKQIDFILDDIRARGVEMEDLQLNLLDHICCIIERDLEENGDFESFYQETIRTFYKGALWEIEEETISLLTFKHYYAMKKLMIWSGAFSVLTLTVGIWFKYMHWPGAVLFVCAGFLAGSLVFLPLVFTLKAKEKQTVKDKFLMAIAALGTAIVCISFLFRVMHWPHSIDMVYLSAALMLLIFLPLYFFSGIRHPEKKLNTIITSMLVILVYGLLFTMLRTPRAVSTGYFNAMYESSNELKILRNEEWLSRRNNDLLPPAIRQLSEQMHKICEESRIYLFWRDSGIDTTSTSHLLELNSNTRLPTDPFEWDQTFREKMDKLVPLVRNYNLELTKLNNKRLSKISIEHSILETGMEHLYTFSGASVLSQLTQIQMFLFQNTRTLLAIEQKKLNG